MRLLLDTHILLWAPGNPARMNAATRGVIEDDTNEVLFSAASLWEIAIKAQLGCLDFQVRPQEIADAARSTGLVELPARAEAAALVANLPLHHRDPSNRLLVAQALTEPLRPCIADPLLQPYSGLVTLIR